MSVQLPAIKRNGEAEALRAELKIPAVVYGPHIESFSIAVPSNLFTKLYENVGESTVIDIVVEGGDTVPVLIQDLQIDPVKRTISHIDFRHVTMGEAMEVKVELVFEGVAPAEKQLGGTLSKGVDSINVRCLPKDLVDHIVIDISVLSTFDDVINTGSIALPEGMTLVDAPEILVAKVAAPMSEEQLKAMDEADTAAPSVEDIEVEEKGKKEEEGEAEAK
ncbi:MAG: 50S ribosomal protein L25 [Candidatus Magasanikbacteria bacterium]|jgi:large subunit ribosomal protein L25|nr:50S ribosomal protein L25 [Candidatus Magasanikbacteria bacterium]MBT4071134.1 50S ribosomal protein L25 [Candidatus Magasanikbacteria bacterium]